MTREDLIHRDHILLESNGGVFVYVYFAKSKNPHENWGLFVEDSEHIFAIWNVFIPEVFGVRFCNFKLKNQAPVPVPDHIVKFFIKYKEMFKKKSFQDIERIFCDPSISPNSMR